MNIRKINIKKFCITLLVCSNFIHCTNYAMDSKTRAENDLQDQITKQNQPFNIIGTDGTTIFLIVISYVLCSALILGYNQIRYEISAAKNNISDFNSITFNLSQAGDILLENQKILACYILYPNNSGQCGDLICGLDQQRRNLKSIEKNHPHVQFLHSMISQSVNRLETISEILYFSAISIFIINTFFTIKHSIKYCKKYFSKKSENN